MLSLSTEIYAFSGKIGSGKNYIAENLFPQLLEKENKPIILAFGDQLKIDLIVSSKDTKLYEKVFYSKDGETRFALQKYGAERRNQEGKDVWVKYLLNWIHLLKDRGVMKFIITDLRYKNELEALLYIGAIIIRVEAPKRNLDKIREEANEDEEKMKKISNHESETDLDDYKDFHFVIKNDPEDENTLIEQLRKIIDD